MNNKIRNVLLKLEANGFDAYVIGGYVRDYLLGRESFDVDICTNAKPNQIKEIFDLGSSTEDNYGRVYFKDSLYNYDITTFRREAKYVDRKPTELDFINDINEDVSRRDFTINTIYMDKNGTIYDPFDGRVDLENKIIRCVGSINDKMVEDPLRMLRLIRFASSLNFEVEENLKNYVKQNKQLITTLSFNRKKEELDKIFKDSNKLKGIELINEYKLNDVLNINFNDSIVYTDDPLGIWAQIDFSDSYSFSKSDTETINNIKKVINYGIIDNVVLYEYGLYVCIIAGEILGTSRSIISDIYKNMPIYSSKDIALNGDDIINILGIEPGGVIKDIIFDLEVNILNNILKNDYDTLKDYLLNNWR